MLLAHRENMLARLDLDCGIIRGDQPADIDGGESGLYVGILLAQMRQTECSSPHLLGRGTCRDLGCRQPMARVGAQREAREA